MDNHRDEESFDTVIEAREEFMVSPSTGSNPTIRLAHFLKPTMSKTPSPRDSPPLPSNSNVRENVPCEVAFNGWLHPQQQWKTWVDLMKPKYEDVWVQAGIDKAIMASTFTINKNSEMLIVLAEKWCCETNTFIFPWGECTVTLEDMKLCGGYSVLGAPVSLSIDTDEEKEIEAKLLAVRAMFFRSKARRADHHAWMMHFMENARSQVEHEAFLALWLSRFVFASKSHRSVLKCVFPLAVKLARGTRVALGPAVLASIYRDLRLLNSAIKGLAKTKNGGVTLWAPFQLVIVWALERFPALPPKPKMVEPSQPIMARWDRLKTMIDNKKLRSIMDPAGVKKDGFLWRPYKNSPPLKLYNTKYSWVCDNPDFHSELDSYIRCLRVSKLVGMSCIEQYFPNRVAMQFGMDQDIPDCTVPHRNKDPWMDYIHPVMDTNLLSALCARQPDVTLRYYAWWRRRKLGKEEGMKTGLGTGNLSRGLSRQVKGDGSYDSPSGLPSKRKRDQEVFNQKHELTIVERLSTSSNNRCFEDAVVQNKSTLSSSESVDNLPSLGEVFQAYGIMSSGVLNFVASDNVVGGSKIANVEDPKAEGSKIISNENAKEGKPKAHKFCGTVTTGFNKEEKGACHCIGEMASYLENRILKLEKMHAMLKLAKFPPQNKKKLDPRHSVP
ncbi:hypothetical protein HN51_000129 [Arachis hypogaea]|uniref:Uncharacterized protein LOC107479463 n=1 Tax=Arachis duranensis TaxID=130453 RepID=A0A6P4CRB6_ARADU|nr:uncharacterized protein LOC107479463 [Arachis duranensis]XP_029150575.1 uncharacterized protein LOC112710927 [Arachis hypogaea]QHO47936.1 Serine/threonine-protein phosphatase 7 long form like [Arachis hypogaea]